MRKTVQPVLCNKLISAIGIVLMLATLLMQANAQGNETGIPMQKNYLPVDYKATGQNFSITTDHRGLLYVANFAGVLEFDGSSWRTILTSERTKVNTLVTDAAGRIFVGTRGEIGYLKPDSLGNLQFVGLNKYLKKYKITFPDVISSYSTPKGVYFITADHIMLWNGSIMLAWRSDIPVISAFFVNNILYVQRKTGGLEYFSGGNFRQVSGGGQFSEQVTVNAMVSFGNGRALIGSGNQGLFVLNNSSISPLPSAANNYLKTNIVSCAVLLKDGTFAIGTVNGGVVNIAADGSIEHIYSKSATGLFDNNIHYLYEDSNHGFWIATDKNICRIEMPSYLTYFNNRKNVNGNVSGVVKFNNRLYITTDQGLFYYNDADLQFKAVPGLQMACLYMIKYHDQLVVATSNGVYSYDGGRAKAIVQNYSTVVYASKTNPNLLYAGQLNGVAVIQNNNGQLNFKANLPGITDEIREVADDLDGATWLQVPSKGLIRYDQKTGRATLYNQSNGLPYNSGNHLNMVANGLVVGTVKGTYRYNKQKDKFEQFNLLKADSLRANFWVNKIVEDKNGNLWTTSGNGTDISYFKKNASGGYVANSTLLAPIKDESIFTIYLDEANAGVWFGSAEQLIFFDTRYAVKIPQIKPALIRSVKINTDSLLFNGTYFNDDNLPGYAQNQFLKPTLNYRQNNISFTFSSPSATGSGDMQYKYYLEGYDSDTSSWVNFHEKEYSNLPAGNYVFNVRAKSVYGAISSPATYAFTITKPYYLTVAAYIVYLLLFIALLYLFVRLRSVQLLKEKKKLEDLIEERTAEVVIQKEAIENQSLELASKNDELEKINLIVKSINSEINFSDLMQAILEKARVIRGAEKAAMLVYDKLTDSFKFKASFGYDMNVLDDIQLSLEEAETRYLSGAEEIYEDIYFIRSVKSIKKDDQFASINKAKSSLMMVIKLNNKIHAFMIMENWQKRNAFVERDFSLLKNLKEHFVAAVIKTNLLEDIQNTLANLKETQEQLIRHEKLASIGQLTKGIVDRILNPLNYINNFSSLSTGLVNESIEVMEKPDLSVDDKDEIIDILTTVKNNIQKVNDHGSSASRIVKGMEKILHEKSGIYVETDINKMVETSIKQAIQELKKDFPNITIKINTRFDPKNQKFNILPYEMNTVMSNLLNNAYYAVSEKYKNKTQELGEITVSTTFFGDSFEISVRDNGKGISETERRQLFSPFYTTKPTAKGIGLGLYLSQDITKEHKGVITMQSEEGKYTEFIIKIPQLKPR